MKKEIEDICKRIERLLELVEVPESTKSKLSSINEVLKEDVMEMVDGAIETNDF